MAPDYDPNTIRPLAGLSTVQTGTAERLGLTAVELEQLGAGASPGFAQALASVVVRYDEAVGELALYP